MYRLLGCGPVIAAVVGPRPRTPIRWTLLACCAPPMSGAARRPPLKPARNARRFIAHLPQLLQGGCQERSDLIIPNPERIPSAASAQLGSALVRAGRPLARPRGPPQAAQTGCGEATTSERSASGETLCSSSGEPLALVAVTELAFAPQWSARFGTSRELLYQPRGSRARGNSSRKLALASVTPRSSLRSTAVGSTRGGASPAALITTLKAHSSSPSLIAFSEGCLCPCHCEWAQERGHAEPAPSARRRFTLMKLRTKWRSTRAV